jgi:hypothetical protein
MNPISGVLLDCDEDSLPLSVISPALAKRCGFFQEGLRDCNERILNSFTGNRKAKRPEYAFSFRKAYARRLL